MGKHFPTKIFLRCREDGEMERSTDKVTWTLTHLSEHKIRENAEIEQLFQKLKDAKHVEDLENYLPFRTQHRIGRTLHRALFPPNTEVNTRWLHLVPVLDGVGGADAERRNESFIDFVCRLPWMFLTRSDSLESEFLVRNNIDPASVTIDAAPMRGHPDLFKDFKLPPHPIVLLVIPTRETDKPTFGSDHLLLLRKALAPAYNGNENAAQLVHVRTREDFLSALEKYVPHIVYFYGHGEADGFTSRFLLDDRGNREDWMDVDDIRDAIKNSPGWIQVPPVVWINACHGATSAGNNFLLALSPVSCSVITSRTVAAVEDSRAIAEKALPRIVVGGQPPHGAVRDVISTSRLPVIAGRWATTVVSVQYELWSALNPEERHVEDLEAAGDFPMRMDRGEALEVVESCLSTRLSGSANAAHVIVWKGPPEQSLDVFARRFRDFVEERFSDWNRCLRKVNLQLGARAVNGIDARAVNGIGERARNRHYLSSIYLGLTGRRSGPDDLAAFGTDEIRRVLRRIITQPRTMLLLLHEQFTQINIDGIRDYLKFWDGLPDELGLADRGVHVILAFAFVEDTTTEAGAGLNDDVILIRLGDVTPRELASHLMSFRTFYDLKVGEIPYQAQTYVGQSGGRFREIHAELEKQANLFRWSLISKDPGV